MSKAMGLVKHGIAITIAALSVGTAAQSSGVGGVYTCVDAKGRKLTADRPIPECNDREQKLLNPRGTVKAKLGPTLTHLEKAELEKKEKRGMEERNLDFARQLGFNGTPSWVVGERLLSGAVGEAELSAALAAARG